MPGSLYRVTQRFAVTLGGYDAVRIQNADGSFATYEEIAAELQDIAAEVLLEALVWRSLDG